MKTKIKRSIWKYVLICFAVLVCYPSAAFSAVPEIINYQGSLSDSGGNPVNATFNITFTLYDDGVAGTNLWQEVQSVTVTNGQFSVQLGADTGGNPLPALLDDPLFLGVQVDADAEMTPRQRITSTAFALRAKTVENDTLNSLSCAEDEIPKFNAGAWACATDKDTNTDAAILCPAGTFLNGDGTCDPVITDTNTTYSAGSGLVLNGTVFSIPTNGIDATHLAANSVGASEIATGAVGVAEIAANAVGSSEVINNSLTGGDIANGSITDVDISDEAGGDFSGANQGIFLDPFPVLVRSVAISAPTPGKVFVHASGTFQFFSALADGATCSITTSTAIDTSHTIRGQDLANNVAYMPFSGTRGFNVATGVTTFNLICQELTGSMALQDSHMTAIFVPTTY
jgi:hypothetical protein